MRKINPKQEAAKYLIRLFLQKVSNFNYGFEMSTAWKLLDKFPETEFWAERREYFGKIRSLKYFMHKEVMISLNKDYNLFLFDRQNKVKNETETFISSSIIEDKEFIRPKAKNLLDFLDN